MSCLVFPPGAGRNASVAPLSGLAVRMDGLRMPSGEDDLIARYFRPLATAPGALGLTDDAAMFQPPDGYDLVLTTDAVVAGMHFVGDEPADLIAAKAMRVNISDLAAKGARPAGCLITLALPTERAGDDFLAGFARGLGADCARYACPLFGGDTVRTDGPLSVSVFAFGVVPRGAMITRSGARPGDGIFVSGTIGDAALGLAIACDDPRAGGWLLADKDRQALAARYHVPQPRLELADTLRACASAAMDVSDGLVGDLGKLCHASGVTARIDVARVPLRQSVSDCVLVPDPSSLELILTGGDDYEILCTVPPTRADLFREQAKSAGVAVAQIGEVVAGQPPPKIIGRDGQAMSFARASFSHF